MVTKYSKTDVTFEEDLISELEISLRRLNKSVSNLVKALEGLEFGEDKYLSRITEKLDNLNSKLFDYSGKWN